MTSTSSQNNPGDSPSSVTVKANGDFFRSERRLWVIAVAILAVALIIWGYFAFTELFGAYREAHNPTEEQVGFHILRVQQDLFRETLAEINSRRLY